MTNDVAADVQALVRERRKKTALFWVVLIAVAVLVFWFSPGR